MDSKKIITKTEKGNSTHPTDESLSMLFKKNPSANIKMINFKKDKIKNNLIKINFQKQDYNPSFENCTTKESFERSSLDASMKGVELLSTDKYLNRATESTEAIKEESFKHDPNACTQSAITNMKTTSHIRKYSQIRVQTMEKITDFKDKINAEKFKALKALLDKKSMKEELMTKRQLKAKIIGIVNSLDHCNFYNLKNNSFNIRALNAITNQMNIKSNLSKATLFNVSGINREERCMASSELLSFLKFHKNSKKGNKGSPTNIDDSIELIKVLKPSELDYFYYKLKPNYMQNTDQPENINEFKSLIFREMKQKLNEEELKMVCNGSEFNFSLVSKKFGEFKLFDSESLIKTLNLEDEQKKENICFYKNVQQLENSTKQICELEETRNNKIKLLSEKLKEGVLIDERLKEINNNQTKKFKRKIKKQIIFPSINTQHRATNETISSTESLDEKFKLSLSKPFKIVDSRADIISSLKERLANYDQKCGMFSNYRNISRIENMEANKVKNQIQDNYLANKKKLLGLN